MTVLEAIAEIRQLYRAEEKRLYITLGVEAAQHSHAERPTLRITMWDGTTFHGPFPSLESAVAFARDDVREVTDVAIGS